jgi:hypothetical protein
MRSLAVNLVIKTLHAVWLETRQIAELKVKHCKNLKLNLNLSL